MRQQQCWTWAVSHTHSAGECMEGVPSGRQQAVATANLHGHRCVSIVASPTVPWSVFRCAGRQRTALRPLHLVNRRGPHTLCAQVRRLFLLRCDGQMPACAQPHCHQPCISSSRQLCLPCCCIFCHRSQPPSTTPTAASLPAACHLPRHRAAAWLLTTGCGCAAEPCCLCWLCSSNAVALW